MDDYRGLTTQIVASYARRNSISTAQISELIHTVYAVLSRLGSTPEPEPEVLRPAVPIRRSVTDQHVVCLECGYTGTMLRRHLTTRHDLSAEAYRERWGLKPDHPLLAPAYSARRSQLAKDIGLGLGRRRVVAEPPPAPEPEPPAPTAAKRASRSKAKAPDTPTKRPSRARRSAKTDTTAPVVDAAAQEGDTATS